MATISQPNVSHPLFPGRLPGGPQGWSREIQAGLGGTDGVRRGAWDESFRPTRASAASRCSCRSEGPDVQARQEAPGACKGQGEEHAGNSLPSSLQVLPSFIPRVSLLQIQLPPRLLDATSFPRPVAVAEESLGCHRTGVSELNIWKKEKETHWKWVRHSDLGTGELG